MRPYKWKEQLDGNIISKIPWTFFVAFIFGLTFESLLVSILVWPIAILVGVILEICIHENPRIEIKVSKILDCSRPKALKPKKISLHSQIIFRQEAQWKL